VIMQPSISTKIKQGDRFGLLTVLYYTGSPKCEYVCKCECGKTCSKRRTYLESFHTPCCGCESKKIWRKNKAKDAVFNRVLERYKSGAVQRDISWNLPKDLFVKMIQMPCFYCGVKASMCGDRVRKSYDSSEFRFNGVDRVDNSQPYTKENVVTCCKTCNMAKREMNDKEFLEWAKTLAKHQKWL